MCFLPFLPFVYLVGMIVIYNMQSTDVLFCLGCFV